MPIKIATWNVNSIRVRLPQVLEWLAKCPVDVLAVQETKMTDDQFPEQACRDAGYHVLFNGQKTYNGVAILSRLPLDEANPQYDLPNYPSDPQKRVLAATVAGIRIVNLYVPNGQSIGSEKYQYKMEWLEHTLAFCQAQLSQHPNMVILGDFNIAPTDQDVHDPEVWQNSVLVSEPEREAFNQFLALGFHDSFRLFPQEEAHFSWWDYRQAAFRRNRGLRIDHILSSEALKKRITACEIDKTPRSWERPSDHTPVIVSLEA